uniref:Uncharacterized protein n=1 Tax=Caldilinea aerophila TaxID=133453 RepID=A0A7C1FHZ4_9CHLR
MFYIVRNHRLFSSAQPPAGLRPITALRSQLLPPFISQLHERLHEWGELGLSPGPITPDRIWCNVAGSGEAQLAFRFEPGLSPRPLTHVGLAQELAAWFVLLDKWMETFVVIARAREIWTVQELAGALTFTSKAFLPTALLHMPPDNWQRVAMALAIAVADGELQKGAHAEKHWVKTSTIQKQGF